MMLLIPQSYILFPIGPLATSEWTEDPDSMFEGESSERNV